MSNLPTQENSTFVIGMADYENDHIKPLVTGKWYSQQDAVARAKQMNEGLETSAYVKQLGYHEFVAYNYFTDKTDYMYEWS
jgi:hypothetical protein